MHGKAQTHLAIVIHVQHVKGFGSLLGRQEVLQVLLDDVVPAADVTSASSRSKSSL